MPPRPITKSGISSRPITGISSRHITKPGKAAMKRLEENELGKSAMKRLEENELLQQMFPGRVKLDKKNTITTKPLVSETCVICHDETINIERLYSRTSDISKEGYDCRNMHFVCTKCHPTICSQERPDCPMCRKPYFCGLPILELRLISAFKKAKYDLLTKYEQSGAISGNDVNDIYNYLDLTFLRDLLIMIFGSPGTPENPIETPPPWFSTEIWKEVIDKDTGLLPGGRKLGGGVFEEVENVIREHPGKVKGRVVTFDIPTLKLNCDESRLDADIGIFWDREYREFLPFLKGVLERNVPHNDSFGQRGRWGGLMGIDTNGELELVLKDAGYDWVIELMQIHGSDWNSIGPGGGWGGITAKSLWEKICGPPSQPNLSEVSRALFPTAHQSSDDSDDSGDLTDSDPDSGPDSGPESDTEGGYKKSRRNSLKKRTRKTSRKTSRKNLKKRSKRKSERRKTLKKRPRKTLKKRTKRTKRSKTSTKRR